MVEHEDGGLLTYGATLRKGDHNHNNRSYTMCVTNTGKLITRKCQHVKPTQITAKQYLHD